MKKSVKIALLLMVSFASFVSSGTANDSEKPKETIRMAMFIRSFQAECWVSKTVDIWFEDIEGLPIETNGPAFRNGFRKASILWVSYGMEGYAIRVVIRYDLSIDKEIANKYALMVSDEVMSIINQRGLPVYWKNTRIDDATDTLVATIDRGLISRNLSSLEGLLRYRPRDGFGSLLTQELFQKFIPGKFPEQGPVIELGLSRLRYTLQRTNNGYRWSFIISFCVRTALKDGEWLETLDLNSLLCNNDFIRPSSRRISEIIVETPKKHSIPIGTYEASFETLYPSANVEEGEWIRVVYQVNAPIDNIVATIRIRLETNGSFDQRITIVVGLLILAFILAVVFKKKRKRR